MNLFKSAKWYKNCQPIAILDSKVLAERLGKLIIIEDEKIKKICDMGIPLIERIQEGIPILRRLFRREIRCSCRVSSNTVLFFRCGVLRVVDVKNKKVHVLWKTEKGYSTPLNLTVCNKGKYIALWGDYFSNTNRKEVKIYGITSNYIVDVIYKFSENTIRHIHNIISDERGGYFVFTGDDDMKAGIYHADHQFQYVEPVYIGDKQARSVVGFVYKDGIVFATDSVSEINYIYFLHKKETSWIKDIIGQLNGSCIYGTKYGNGFLFSTTVEPLESDGTLKSYLSRKPGEGILSDYVEIVELTENLRCEVVGRLKKDWLPYKLFEYGTIRFINDGSKELICIYPVAVKNYDGYMGIVEQYVYR